ncbi:MAG: ribonuclease P protein component [Eudoraea sp.]|uniref:ribonuclease P protein component n=2 Tax=Eudoraea sp. TaxID=1979955 RepID=UPI003C70F701
MSLNFSKEEKLKSKIVIGALFQEGRSIKRYPLKLLYLKMDPPLKSRIQCGVTVSKRSFKSAVDRNRIKRLIREAYRLNKGEIFNNIEGSYAFLFLYIGKEIPGFEEIDKPVKAIFKNLITQANNEE